MHTNSEVDEKPEPVTTTSMPPSTGPKAGEIDSTELGLTKVTTTLSEANITPPNDNPNGNAIDLLPVIGVVH